MDVQWVRAARSGEIDRCLQVLRRPRGGRVLILGPAGAGKAVFARALEDALAVRGLWVDGMAGIATVPYGALGPYVEQSAAAEDAAQTVADHARGRLVLVSRVDLLDSDSAAVVRALVAGCRDTTVAATGRADGNGVEEFAAAGRFTRVELPDLDLEATRAALAHVLGGDVEPHTADRFWTASEGRLALLAEAVEEAVRRGTLADVDGVWQLDGPVPPPRVAPPAAGRQVREVLTQVAIAGAVEPEVFGDLARGVDDGAALRRQLTLPAPGTPGVVRVADPALRRALLATLGVAARLRLAAGVVAAYRAHPELCRGSVAFGRALAAAADPAPEPAAVVAAARAAAWTDPGEAEGLARYAVARGCGRDAPLLLAQVLADQGRPCEAEEVLRTCGPHGDAAVDCAHVENLAWVAGDPAQARAVVREPSAAAAATALAAFAHGSPRTAPQVGPALLRDPAATPEAAALAAPVVALDLAWTGRHREALEVLAAARRPGGNTSALGAALLDWAEAAAHLSAGDLVRARAVAARCEQRTGPRVPGAVDALTIGQVALACGDAAGAVTWLRRAQVVARRHGPHLIAPVAAAALAAAHASAGEPDHAEDALAAVGARAHPHLLDAETLLTQAWVAAARSRTPAAVALAHQAARAARELPAPHTEAAALHLAQLLGDTGVQAPLADLADRTGDPLTGLMARQARAVAARDADTLDTVAGEFTRAGAHLLAADAAAQAAAVHRRADRSLDSARSAATARRLAHAAGAPQRPTVRHCHVCGSLTSREQQVAHLVVAGRTSRQIAEEVNISHRTVENHVQRIFAKLGVSSRAALTCQLRTA